MDDWRYENLKTDVRELRKEMGELRGRTSKVESWQSFLPLRVMMVVSWLAAIGIWAVNIAR